MNSTIRHPEYFQIFSEDKTKKLFGCDQEWYQSHWQRISGCGPTAASNLMYYISRNQQAALGVNMTNDKEKCLTLMEKVWAYVTPTQQGVDTTKLFVDSLGRYLDELQLKAELRVLNIAKDIQKRPTVEDVVKFIDQAMRNDAPVAFLNLCNGDETALEEWHWVTVISLEFNEDTSRVYVEILDESQIKRINLSLWLSTTMRGGGFVYIDTRLAR